MKWAHKVQIVTVFDIHRLDIAPSSSSFPLGIAPYLRIWSQVV